MSTRKESTNFHYPPKKNQKTMDRPPPSGRPALLGWRSSLSRISPQTKLIPPPSRPPHTKEKPPPKTIMAWTVSNHCSSEARRIYPGIKNTPQKRQIEKPGLFIPLSLAHRPLHSFYRKASWRGAEGLPRLFHHVSAIPNTRGRHPRPFPVLGGSNRCMDSVINQPRPLPRRDYPVLSLPPWSRGFRLGLASPEAPSRPTPDTVILYSFSPCFQRVVTSAQRLPLRRTLRAWSRKPRGLRREPLGGSR